MTGLGAYDDRDIYRSFLAGALANFATSTVAISIDGLVAGAGTDFQIGMPLGSAPVGGSVLPGDLLIVTVFNMRSYLRMVQKQPLQRKVKLFQGPTLLLVPLQIGLSSAPIPFARNNHLTESRPIGRLLWESLTTTTH